MDIQMCTSLSTIADHITIFVCSVVFFASTIALVYVAMRLTRLLFISTFRKN